MATNNYITDGSTTYYFVNISQLPATVSPKMVLESRDGVDGHAVWNTGDRGEVQQIMTTEDVADVATAIARADAYLAFKNKLVEITYANVLRPKKYDVLEVITGHEFVRAISLGVGGNAGTSGAFVRAIWTVIATTTDSG